MIQRNLELMLKTLEVATLTAERVLEIAVMADDGLTSEERFSIDNVRRATRGVVSSIQSMELPK